MSDIFAEVDADLRRDRWQTLWDRYGLLIIGGAVGIVLLVAIIVGYRAFQQSKNEAASLRYEALIQQIEEEDNATKFELLNTFAQEENNGYGALAAFGAARAASENGDFTAALAGFDALAARGDLARPMRDYARLQAATILLDNNGAIDEIAARLTPILDNDNALRATARDILALAYVLADDPLQARLLYQEQLADETATRLACQRAQIMLGEVELILAPGANGANAAESAGQ